MKEFWQQHGDALVVVLLPILIEFLNKVTKRWQERKTFWGRVLGWVLECAHRWTYRKPDLRRDPIELWEKEPTQK